MDLDELDSIEEQISDSFLCCICLDLLYKPVVLSCGHVSCFWCVHRSMSGTRKSHCPICRNAYNHFPTVCQLLYFLLQKMYPLAHKRRELQILEEEKKTGQFSPQFRSLVLHDTCSTTPEEAPKDYSVLIEEEKEIGHFPLHGSMAFHDTCTNAPVDAPKDNFRNQQSQICKQITREYVLCARCKQLLFRPVVLNCGHVYCESCLVHVGNESIRCQVCQSLHPSGVPKVVLDLDRFLEYHFPSEYALRRDTTQHKGSIEAANQPDKPPLSANRESVHLGVGCDFCGMFPITGDRYNCKDCKESIGFDLCGDCYNTPSKLPGRFNQQHTPQHKLELVAPIPYRPLVFSFRAPGGHILDSTTAAAIIGNYSTEDLEDGSTPLSLTSSMEENVDSSGSGPDSSSGGEQV